MINLLPPDEKRQLAAARTNTLLLRYSVLLVGIVGVLALETLGMYLVVDTGTAQSKQTIQENEQKTASYSTTKQQAEVFASNLATAKYVLGKQVPYTTLIFALAGSLPEGTVLDVVALDPATFGTPTTITVKSTTYQKAIDVKTALQAAKVNGETPLFSSVSFQSVAASEDTTTKYRYTSVYSIVYSRAVLAE